MITAFLTLIPVPMPKGWNLNMKFADSRRKAVGVKAKEQNPSLKNQSHV